MLFLKSNPAGFTAHFSSLPSKDHHPRRPSGNGELCNSQRDRRVFQKFFLGSTQIIIAPTHAALPRLGQTLVPSARQPPEGALPRTTLGAWPHNSAMHHLWLNFSGNWDATHTFPFFVARQDESRFSEVCSAPGFRSHQLPRSRRLQP